MAGISINAIVGDNGIIAKAKKAAEDTQRAGVKEELELKILDLQMEKIEKGEDVSLQEVVDRLNTLENIEMDIENGKIEGEYKNYLFEVGNDIKLELGEKATGGRPSGFAEVITLGEGLTEVQIQVKGIIEGGAGEIATIEALEEDVELKEGTSEDNKIYVVKGNGTYGFRIIATNGRKCKVYCTVTNMIITGRDLLDAVAQINESGIREVRVVGKTSSGAKEDKRYKLDVIYWKEEGKEELVLDGKTRLTNDNFAGTTYQFGQSGDIGTASTDATATVVLKVEGNLTINSGITVTAIGSQYGGPKGMIIYCTGTLKNEGSITMTARGAKGPGENVYLFQNSNGSFEYVPAVGGNGGSGVGVNGKSPVGRGTGGGGSGGGWGNHPTTGAGSSGTSYCGGSGGGCRTKLFL